MRPSSLAILAPFLFAAGMCVPTITTAADPAVPEGPGFRVKTSEQERAALQARAHRLLADLIEAKASEKPDGSAIARLERELASVRDELSASAPPESPAPSGSDAAPAPKVSGRGLGWRGGRGPGQAPGFGRGRGQTTGGDVDSGFEKDRNMFHLLLDNRQAIRRTVKKIDGGVETVTESDDPKIAATIQEHVASMKQRVEQGRPIHMRDPLFAAVFANAGTIGMKYEKTDKGVRVEETSTDPYVARLIQAHAEVVNLFVAHGRAEARKNHAVPQRP